MAENKLYLALGEEAVRGTSESGTVGFIPLLSPGIPKMEFNDTRRDEFRGEDSIKGGAPFRRMDRKWSSSLEIPFFTEAGGLPGIMGTFLKHFFGHVTSTENALTGQYSHSFSPVADPFASNALGTRALTLNLNINEGNVMNNWPFVGGRVSSLAFNQEAGQNLKLTADIFGQFRDVVTASTGGELFAAENLRCDYNNLLVYTGPVSRAGTAPDFTDITFTSATQIKPDKVSIKFENGMSDVLRLSGLDYPDKTRMGSFKVSLEMTMDWEDPASGFSSVTEFNNWMDSASSTNFVL
ncbi:MAG: phage tail tube protein, partial [Thermodesulfobacteriota bacterium]